MNFEVHILSHDGEQMIDWAIRHWWQFADKIVVHDGGPKGRADLAKIPGVFVVAWDTGGQLNDALAADLKNNCWKGTDADLVACVDADELLWFPEGAERTLESYVRRGAAFIKPRGVEMFSEDWYEAKDHPGKQITELIRDGASEEKWYSKPALFSPKLVAESGFGIGAHEAVPTLKDGRGFKVDKDWPHAEPPCYLLHFKAVGPIERVAARYDETRKRLAKINVQNRWGNVDDTGMEHALKKRALIMPGLRRIIP